MSEQLRKVDLEADLNAREEDGYCWSLLSDAADPTLVEPGAIIVAGEPDTPALVEVIDLQDIGHDTIVLRIASIARECRRRARGHRALRSSVNFGDALCRYDHRG